MLPADASVVKTVQDFCKGPEIKKLKCGWDDDETDKSGFSTDLCDMCGRIWGNWIREKDIPREFEPFDCCADYRSPRGWISLACRPGRLVVRIVYKVLKPASGPLGGLTSVTLLNPGELGSQGANPTKVRRCSLEIPGHKPGPVTGPTPKSEVDAALKQAKEANCKETASFGDFKEGGWYSDTFFMDWTGCEGVLKADTKKYVPARPWITNNPGRPGFLLAKFEVQEA